MAAAVEACANCGHERDNRFCPRCGQNDRDYKRSLWRLVADLIKETFEVDGRLPRTLRPMFLRPGQLAVEFSRNRRASYVSPIRLYLFASILFFFVLAVVVIAALPSDAPPDSLGEGAQRKVEPLASTARKGAAPLTREDLARERKEAPATCADLDIERLHSVLSPHRRRMLEDILTRDGPKPFVCNVLNGLTMDWTHASPATGDGSGRDGTPPANTRLGPIRTFVAGAAVEVLHNWRAATSQLLDYLPLAMFVTLPAYALLLKVFFYSSGRYYTEHLVFAMHLHTFSFLVYTLTLVMPDASILPGFFGKVLEWVSTGLWLWVVAYSYLALRRYYRDGRFLTTIKWLVLGGCYAVLLIPGLLLSVVATLLFL